jgi:hypothetical protein
MNIEKKHNQNELANNWQTYIKATLLMAYNSPTRYTVVPYKKLNGIKKAIINE